MAYIYKITNTVNNKVYIGKTEKINPIDRWSEHKNDMLKETAEVRPLYRAIKKYGIDNFVFEIIEKTNEPEKREIELIKEYNSYIGFYQSNGYNATLGGDGRKYIDEEKVISLYLENLKNSITLVAKELDISSDTASAILKRNGIEIKETKTFLSKKILQIDKETNDVIQSFNSGHEAARFLGDERKRQHIEEVCKGIRKSAYGFKWKYME